MGPAKHVTVAELKQSFEDLVGEARRARSELIVEKDGTAIAAVLPLRQEQLEAGPRLAELAGTGGQEAEEFYRFMLEVVRNRGSRRLVRDIPLPDVE